MRTCICGRGRSLLQQRHHGLSARWQSRPAFLGVRAQTAMAQPERVLLTNDDGPESQFFKAWVPHIQQVLGWNAYVCIPDGPQSFVSKAIGKGPIGVRHMEDGAAHVAGPPATCVNIALNHLAADCDFVVSGPNVGHNAGRGSVLSSGTVGAALEGSIGGRKAVAISFPFFQGWNNWTTEDIDTAVEAAGKVVKELWETWEEGVDLYNCNVPLGFTGLDGNPVRPQCMRTSVDPVSYASLYKPSEEGDESFVWGPTGLRVFQEEDRNLLEGSDVWAVKRGNISITALKAGFRQP